MTLRRVGFFKELRHGDSDGPSLLLARRDAAHRDFKHIIEYLRNGTVVVATGVNADDIIDPANKRVAPLAVQSDGVWAWSGDLAYYVEKYACELPEEFIDHMRAQGWTPSALVGEQLLRVGNELAKKP